MEHPPWSATADKPATPSRMEIYCGFPRPTSDTEIGGTRRHLHRSRVHESPVSSDCPNAIFVPDDHAYRLRQDGVYKVAGGMGTSGWCYLSDSSWRCVKGAVLKAFRNQRSTAAFVPSVFSPRTALIDIGFTKFTSDLPRLMISGCFSRVGMTPVPHTLHLPHTTCLHSIGKKEYCESFVVER